jgi:hypothetical protein
MNEIIRGYWAGAKYNGDFYCVETLSGYRGSCTLDPKGKQHLLPPEVSDEILGLAVRDALAHSRFVLPERRTDVWQHPDVEFDLELDDYKKTAERYAAWIKNLMEHYGYKTKRALFKDMESCTIVSRSGLLTIQPSRHQKLEQWGREKTDQIEDVTIPADSAPAEIGAALRLAFRRCGDIS